MTPPRSQTMDRLVGSPILTGWTAAHVRTITPDDSNSAPVLSDGDVIRVVEDIDIWDAWPIQDEDGSPSALPTGETLWMALGAPQFADPDERHGHARIHLFARSHGQWRHLGPAMPDGLSPGSREWSGSAVLAADRRGLTLYFTATGQRDEATLTFEQRLFRASATLEHVDGAWRLVDWRDLREMFARDPDHYMASDAGGGAVGTIKAFRDPAYFRDPEDGRHYVFFAGSLANSQSAYNGIIGSAVAESDKPDHWRITTPIISADRLNNELERPHVIHRNGLFYLFWSTQRAVFNPDGPTGPTGLYGMVSEQLLGGWRPLNGTGLVLANPPAAPNQAYSWLVMPDLQVTSFVDDWGSDGSGATEKRFGATFAPMLRLHLDGAVAGLAL